MRSIPEIDVLIATVRWFQERQVAILSVSVSKGQGIDHESAKQRLKEVLTNEVEITADGPDLTAFDASRREFWQIECKGSGTGKKATQRNNFDRALASVVSYFKESSISQLGLALPATPDYLDQLKKRVRKPLRERLRLWVFLLEYDGSIEAVSPNNEI